MEILSEVYKTTLCSPVISIKWTFILVFWKLRYQLEILSYISNSCFSHKEELKLGFY